MDTPNYQFDAVNDLRRTSAVGDTGEQEYVHQDAFLPERHLYGPYDLGAVTRDSLPQATFGAIDYNSLLPLQEEQPIHSSAQADWDPFCVAEPTPQQNEVYLGEIAPNLTRPEIWNSVGFVLPHTIFPDLQYEIHEQLKPILDDGSALDTAQTQEDLIPPAFPYRTDHTFEWHPPVESHEQRFQQPIAQPLQYEPFSPGVTGPEEIHYFEFPQVTQSEQQKAPVMAPILEAETSGSYKYQLTRKNAGSNASSLIENPNFQSNVPLQAFESSAIEMADFKVIKKPNIVSRLWAKTKSLFGFSR